MHFQGIFRRHIYKLFDQDKKSNIPGVHEIYSNIPNLLWGRVYKNIYTVYTQCIMYVHVCAYVNKFADKQKASEQSSSYQIAYH